MTEQRVNPLSWTGRFNATGRPTLEAFLLSQAFARAVIGPITGGRKFTAAHYIRQLAGATAARQVQRRWRILAVAPRHGEDTSRAVWAKCTPGVGEWSKGGIPTHSIMYPDAPGQPVIEMLFLDWEDRRHQERLVQGNCSLVWLDQARDLPEDAFHAACRAIECYWPNGLERQGAPIKRIIVTSRMPMIDHWIPRRFREGDGEYALFRQPDALGPAAEDRHLQGRPNYYRDEAAGMPVDWVRVHVNAEYGMRPETINGDAEFAEELWRRLGALDGGEDQGERSAARRAAIAGYGETLTGGELRAVARDLARNDLFFLLAVVLGRGDINRDWLFARCREVQASPDGHLDLWAREHYKSTIITYGKTIQDILVDPETTVGIFSFNRPIAKAFLRQIKREFENNQLLLWLFFDVLWRNPQRDAPKWSEDEGIVVRRRGNPKESTIEAWGLVDGQPTSKHYRLIVYDDVVTKESVTTPEAIRKVTEAWEASLNLSSEGGRLRYLGTRWSVNDTYRIMLQRGAAIERRHAATVDGTAEGAPVLMTADALAKRRKDQGPYTFGSQMLLDPTADRAAGFKDEWVHYYRAGGDFSRMNKYILVDPASAKKRDSDYTAMGVIGLGDDDNYYLLDGIRDRLSLRERGDRLFELHRRWKPKGVGYEKYGMQADIEYLEERMASENYRFAIQQVGGQLAKNDRIRRLVPDFEAGHFFLPETLRRVDYEGRMVDLVDAFLNEEYRPFPVGLHDDFFDMLSRIKDIELVWPKAVLAQDRYERNRKRAAWRRFSAWAA